MFRPVSEVCGLIESFHADASAAMRRASVTPPVFERSGWILDHPRELEARVVILAGGERHGPRVAAWA